MSIRNGALALRQEKLLAIAHRALWSAAAIAEQVSDQATADDLYMLQAEVSRLIEASARRGTRLRTRTTPRA